MENRNKFGHRSKVAWANEPNQEHLLLQSTLLFGYRVFFGVCLDPLILQLYNMRSFLTLIGGDPVSTGYVEIRSRVEDVGWPR